MFIYAVLAKEAEDCDIQFFKEYRARCTCSKCGNLLPHYRDERPDIKMQYRLRGRPALRLAHVKGGIIHVDFLSLFEKEFREVFHLGKVYDHLGGVQDRFISYRAIHPITERSVENQNRICEKCGAFVYTPLGADRTRFIMRSAFAESPLRGGGFSVLYMTQELRDRIDIKQWKGLLIAKVQAVDEPLDGIDPFPENYY